MLFHIEPFRSTWLRAISPITITQMLLQIWYVPNLIGGVKLPFWRQPKLLGELDLQHGTLPKPSAMTRSRPQTTFGIVKRMRGGHSSHHKFFLRITALLA